MVSTRVSGDDHRIPDASRSARRFVFCPYERRARSQLSLCEAKKFLARAGKTMESVDLPTWREALPDPPALKAPYSPRLASAPLPIAFQLEPEGYREQLASAPSYWAPVPPPMLHVTSVHFVLLLEGAPMPPVNMLDEWVRTATRIGRDDWRPTFGTVSLRYRDVYGMAEYLRSEDRSIFDNVKILVYVPQELNPALCSTTCFPMSAMQLASHGRLPRDIISLVVKRWTGAATGARPMRASRATDTEDLEEPDPLAHPQPWSPWVNPATAGPSHALPAHQPPPPRMTLPLPDGWSAQSYEELKAEWIRHKTWQAEIALDPNGFDSRRLLSDVPAEEWSSPPFARLGDDAATVTEVVYEKRPPATSSRCRRWIGAGVIAAVLGGAAALYLPSASITWPVMPLNVTSLGLALPQLPSGPFPTAYSLPLSLQMPLELARNFSSTWAPFMEHQGAPADRARADTTEEEVLEEVP